jgi:exoribonuclease-2
VEIAAGLGTTLPAEPDSKALNEFLLAQKQKDPDHFPDLSLAFIKLMGPGEYVLVKPGEQSPGHFGLAVAVVGALVIGKGVAAAIAARVRSMTNGLS